jgi:hypothetical protein
MNPQTDNSKSPPPNFDFITSQKNPGSGEKKKFSKKVIVLFGLLVVLIIVAIISLISSASKNVQETTTATPEQVNQAQDVVENFLNLVNTDKSDEAAALFSSDTLIPEDAFKEEGVKLLKTLTLSECKPQAEATALVDEDGRIIRVYECPMKDEEGLIVGLRFLVDDNAGSFTIYEYQLLDLE